MQNNIWQIRVLLLWAALFSIDGFAKPSLFSMDVKWSDQNGKQFEFQELKDHTTVLAMVYTSCDYSCPLITRKLVAIYNKTPKKRLSRTRFLLITFDPERDTVKKLKEYSLSQKLDEKSFSLLTSSEQNTHALSVALNFQYKKMGNGHFSHSNQITVLNKQGEIVLQQDINQDLDPIFEIIKK